METSVDGKAPVALARALVEFTLHGSFPEENVSTLVFDRDELAPALKALDEARESLQGEIEAIIQDTAQYVSTWLDNAKSLEVDMKNSRRTADEMERDSHAPDLSGEAIWEAEQKVEFLAKEMNFSERLHHALESIKAVNDILDGVEAANHEKRILDALRLLEESRAAVDKVSVSKTCRAMKLLDVRVFELANDLHEVFDHIWDTLIHVDHKAKTITIRDSHPDVAVSLSDVVEGLQFYDEVDKRTVQFCHDVDKAVVAPRTDPHTSPLPGVSVDETTLALAGTTDNSVKTLFQDLKKIFTYLSERLPPELVSSMSSVMMPGFITRIISTWLDLAVPASLRDMDKFEEIMASAEDFCSTLAHLNYSGFDELHEWVGNAPKVWLSKCREAALDTVRSRLAEGLGEPKEVERVETQKVTRSEGKELAAANRGAGNQDWDAAWSDGQDDAEVPLAEPVPEKADMPSESAVDDSGGADAWGWGDDEGDEKLQDDLRENDANRNADGQDDVDAWGWGDDGAGEPEPVIREPEGQPIKVSGVQTAPKSAPQPMPEPETREFTLKEVYRITSLPESILSLITSILSDGSLLTSDSHASSLVSSAAGGLFALPTLALALFRAISPYYYELKPGGSMYLYNDATYLSSELSSLAIAWKDRDDLTKRAKAMIRLDGDIKTLVSFANRAYKKEMNLQKTILTDLLGGTQNFLQQPSPSDPSCTASVEAAVIHVRETAKVWKEILASSAWHQAVGSLVDTAAKKLVVDTLDMPSIGKDDAFDIANLITKMTELDDLFLPPKSTSSQSRSRKNSAPLDEADAWGWGDNDDAENEQGAAVTDSDTVPSTAQFAASWLRLKYLSEILQSNLSDVNYLWFESELSLHFTADEVIELIGLSFEKNARARDLVRKIERTPHPLGNQSESR